MKKGPSENPNLPTNEKIKANSKVIGGELHIIGLSAGEAEALVQYAQDNGIAGTGIKVDELSPNEKQRFGVGEDTKTVYLGHTTNCHLPLFENLGIE